MQNSSSPFGTMLAMSQFMHHNGCTASKCTTLKYTNNKHVIWDTAKVLSNTQPCTRTPSYCVQRAVAMG